MSANLFGNSTVQAGKRDRLITIERAVNSTDAAGGPVQTWSSLTTLWAQMIPISGAELLRFGREVSNESVRFRTLYYSGITELDRINYGSKLYNIRSVSELGRGAGLELLGEVIA